MRSAVLTAGSLALTALVLANAWFQRQQFYPSVVYITKSNPSMAVIYLQSLVMVILMGKLMRKIFFGQLRAAEFEHLMERSWYAVTETCLAFTVFKDDFSPKFVALFTLLLFLKSFHWLAEDRVDYMERSPVITLLFHLRVLSLAIVLASLDMFFMQHAYTSTLTKGASVQLVFGFEYAILLTIVLNTVVKYVLHSIDLHSDNPWENKAVFMLYTELLVGLVKVLLYVLFFVIMVRIYTLPLFAVRPMYLTMRAFKKAFNDVVLSRRAIHNMNTLYPDATAEELANTDNVCIICREEMTAPSAKKLPCGHIFHRTCLRSWFQRQQTCPTCRLDVLRAPTTSAANQGVAAAGRGQQPANQAAAQFQAQMVALRNQLEAMEARRQQQPAAQPQPAAAQAPQQPPNLFNLLAAGQMGALPGFVPPAAPAPAADPTPPATGASGSGAGTTSSAEGGATATPAGSGNRPPFMFPPFPFLPAPYLPPPLPPTNFSGLSDAELNQMEGQERSNVEARIKCLKNIQVLLDAAVMEMQQYSAVVARCNTTVGPPAASGNSSATSAAAGASAASEANTSNNTAASTTASTSVSDKVNTSEASSLSSSVLISASDTSDKASTQLTFTSGASSSVTSSSPLLTPVTNGIERPPSETGARPKVAPKITTVNIDNKETEEKSETEENPFQKLSNESSSRSAEQEEIRRRRLAVFEEQKKRLMSK